MNSIIITLKINSNDKEMFDFSNYSAQSRYYDNSNKLFVCTMKDETAGIAATLSHNEYNDALFNIKYLRHSVNRIQSIDDGVGTSEINKIFFCLTLMIKYTWKAMGVTD